MAPGEPSGGRGRGTAGRAERVRSPRSGLERRRAGSTLRGDDPSAARGRGEPADRAERAGPNRPSLVDPPGSRGASCYAGREPVGASQRRRRPRKGGGGRRRADVGEKEAPPRKAPASPRPLSSWSWSWSAPPPPPSAPPPPPRGSSSCPRLALLLLLSESQSFGDHGLRREDPGGRVHPRGRPGRGQRKRRSRRWRRRWRCGWRRTSYCRRLKPPPRRRPRQPPGPSASRPPRPPWPWPSPRRTTGTTTTTPTGLAGPASPAAAPTRGSGSTATPMVRDRHHDDDRVPPDDLDME